MMSPLSFPHQVLPPLVEAQRRRGKEAAMIACTNQYLSRTPRKPK